MAQVAVFVDRVVQGDLPMVCAKTGAPASGKVRVVTSVRSVSWAWLLVLAGPPGWLALAIILWIGGEQLEGRVPMSQAAFDRIEVRKGGAWIALGAAVVSIILALVLQFPGLLSLVLLGLVAFVAFLVGANWASVDLKLDASRRWVTISGSHPDFVAAVQADQARERADSLR